MRNFMLFTAIRAQLNSDAGEGEGMVELPDLIPTGDEIEALAKDAELPEDHESEQQASERKARLAEAEAKARKTANDGTACPDELIGLAQREIKECWKEFAGQGGVWDLQQKAKRKLGNISQHILSIAKECAVHSYERAEASSDPENFDAIKLAGAMFRNAMASAELALRASLNLADDDAEKRLDAFLSGSWNVYKSQVKSGFDAGFDPKDYDSIYAMTQAVKAAKDAKSTKTRTDGDKDKEGTKGDDKGDSAPMSVDEIADAVDGGAAPVHQAVVTLLKSVKFAVKTVENHEKIANIINLARREIDKLSMVKPGTQPAENAPVAKEA